MKRISIFLLLLLPFYLFTKCITEDVSDRNYPRLMTLDVSDNTVGGARYNARFLNPNKNPIRFYGFVWSEEHLPNLEESEKVVFSEPLISNKFSSEITTTLLFPYRYYVRAFIITDDYLVYGNEVYFLSNGSLAPTISSFAPQSASWSDTLRIWGKGFSNMKSKNSVFLGAIETEVITYSDSLLTIKVPEKNNAHSVPLSVTLTRKTATAVGNFLYLVPTILSVAPLSGKIKDTITVTGINFNTNPKFNNVTINEISAPVVSISKTAIRVLVPETLTRSESSLILRSMGNTIIWPQSFKLDIH